MFTRRRLPLLFAIASAAACSACGSMAGPTAASGSPGATVEVAAGTPQPLLQHTVRSAPALGITLAPPPQGAVGIDVAKASAAASAVFGTSAVDTMKPQLAVLNDAVTGTIQADGSVAHSYVNRLVWAFIGYAPCSANSRIDPIPVPGAPPPAAESTTTARCTGVILVDANSGRYLEAYSEAADAATIAPVPGHTSLPVPPGPSARS